MNKTFYVFPSWVYRNLSYKNIPLENFINKVGLDMTNFIIYLEYSLLAFTFMGTSTN